MYSNDLTFFTNEPERNLYDRFNKILNNARLILERFSTLTHIQHSPKLIEA